MWLHSGVKFVCTEYFVCPFALFLCIAQRSEITQSFSFSFSLTLFSIIVSVPFTHRNSKKRQMQVRKVLIDCSKPSWVWSNLMFWPWKIYRLDIGVGFMYWTLCIWAWEPLLSIGLCVYFTSHFQTQNPSHWPCPLLELINLHQSWPLINLDLIDLHLCYLVPEVPSA